MRKRVEEADGEAAVRHPVTVDASRRQVLDLLEAVGQLNSMNPWYRGVARRLRALAISLGDALDRSEDERRRAQGEPKGDNGDDPRGSPTTA